MLFEKLLKCYPEFISGSNVLEAETSRKLWYILKKAGYSNSLFLIMKYFLALNGS
jgi:hypothetical protein